VESDAGDKGKIIGTDPERSENKLTDKFSV
jgi:hypothetical protein